MSFPEPYGRALLAGHVDQRETGRGQSLRATVLLLAYFKTHVARAELRRPAPHQELVAALECLAFFVDRFSEAVEPRRLGRQVRLDAFAGIDAIPAARRHRAVLVYTERSHH